MAYYSNGSEGEVFDCKNCKFQEHACPIAAIQLIYNYDACNNEVARKILDDLVPQNSHNCSFYEFAKDDLFEDGNQLKLEL